MFFVNNNRWPTLNNTFYRVSYGKSWMAYSVYFLVKNPNVISWDTNSSQIQGVKVFFCFYWSQNRLIETIWNLIQFPLNIPYWLKFMMVFCNLVALILECRFFLFNRSSSALTSMQMGMGNQNIFQICNKASNVKVLLNKIPRHENDMWINRNEKKIKVPQKIELLELKSPKLKDNKNKRWTGVDDDCSVALSVINESRRRYRQRKIQEPQKKLQIKINHQHHYLMICMKIP